jgi:hypothetical protein
MAHWHAYRSRFGVHKLYVRFTKTIDTVGIGHKKKLITRLTRCPDEVCFRQDVCFPFVRFKRKAFGLVRYRLTDRCPLRVSRQPLGTLQRVRRCEQPTISDGVRIFGQIPTSYVWCANSGRPERMVTRTGKRTVYCHAETKRTSKKCVRTDRRGPYRRCLTDVVRNVMAVHEMRKRKSRVDAPLGQLRSGSISVIHHVYRIIVKKNSAINAYE